MPRFFIDYQDANQSHFDSMGSRLPSLAQARVEALGAFPEITKGMITDGMEQTFTATVRDESGMPVYRATLKFTGECVPSVPRSVL
ncbi:MAG: hypothetical protein EOO77_13365 [Oxalobacteraceae bacterium]|nr:MAG: hypothetical protein EOO77_13365 [Oxalobacteraceae bacterium]